MKPISIQFTNEKGEKTKTYTSCTIKTGVMDRIFDIAEKAEDYEHGKLSVHEAREFFKDLKAIVVDTFGRQFTYDELDEGLNFEDLIAVFGSLCANLTGGLGKN